MNKARIKLFFRNLVSYSLLIALLVVGGAGAFWTKTVYKEKVEANKEKAVENLCINTLLLGVDKAGTNTDVIIFCQLDVAKGTLNMLQIPRDTYVEGVRRFNKKINAAYFCEGRGNIENVYKEVEMVTGIRPDNHILIDISGFRNIIDAMGGVPFNVTQRMYYNDPDQNLLIDLYPGEQVLNGSKAEQLVRFRQYVRGDIERVAVQKKFIYATIDKAFSVSSLFNISDIIDIMVDSCESSFTSDEMYKYGPVIVGINKENINILTLEGVDEYRNNISYYIPNDELNKEIKEKYFDKEPDNAQAENAPAQNQ